jgi:predicted nucleic acid-binding protein
VIIFYASYLVVRFHPNPAPARDREDKPVSRFRERVSNLASKLDVSNDVIGVPTPAMAEILVRAGSANARAAYVTTISDTWKFQILPFDSRAAIEAAELIAKIKSEQRSQPWETWAKVKFDIQIAAIAKAEAATAIYSDDRDVENHGKRVNIPVIRICDLPTPTGRDIQDRLPL